MTLSRKDLISHAEAVAARFTTPDNIRELITDLVSALTSDASAIEDARAEEREACAHCNSGFLGDRFGQDVECVNGVLIDIDVFREGWQRDVLYPLAPCHPEFEKPEDDQDNDSQQRLESAAREPSEWEEIYDLIAGGITVLASGNIEIETELPDRIASVVRSRTPVAAEADKDAPRRGAFGRKICPRCDGLGHLTAHSIACSMCNGSGEGGK